MNQVDFKLQEEIKDIANRMKMISYIAVFVHNLDRSPVTLFYFWRNCQYSKCN